MLGRATMPSTVSRQSANPLPARRLNASPKGATSFANGVFEIWLRSELTRQRVASQDSLRRIGQRFARAVEAAAIGRDESITTAQASQPRPARMRLPPPSMPVVMSFRRENLLMRAPRVQ